jgi:hypothetical protein
MEYSRWSEELFTGVPIRQTSDRFAEFRVQIGKSIGPGDEDAQALFRKAYEIEQALHDGRSAETIRMVRELAIFYNLPGRDKIDQYLPLAIELGTTAGGKETVAVVERGASMNQAWRLRREGFVMGFSSVVGGYIASEKIESVKADNGSLGLFAPTGLSITYSESDDLAQGLLVSFADVGSLLSLSQEKGDVKGQPNAGYSQIFAPGLYYFWSAGKSPWVWGAGIAFFHGLRSQEGSDIKLDVVRTSVFVGLDFLWLPVVHSY